MSCGLLCGPALRAEISAAGMRATDGAIEAIKLDKETLEPTYSVIGDPEPNR